MVETDGGGGLEEGETGSGQFTNPKNPCGHLVSFIHENLVAQNGTAE